jgi:hypothetical protein
VTRKDYAGRNTNSILALALVVSAYCDIGIELLVVCEKLINLILSKPLEILIITQTTNARTGGVFNNFKFVHPRSRRDPVER